MRTFLQMVLFVFLLIYTALSSNLQKDSRQFQAARLDHPIKIDGNLEEKVWKNGHNINEFLQRNPIEGSNPTEKTDVRIAYDDQALYIGARLFDSCPDSIIARLGRRDVGMDSDMFGFFIDPYHDRRSGYYFAINAAGTLYDGVLLNDDWDDESWDGVWEGRAKIDNMGWTVEMRIPFSQLRFQKKDEYKWGINFRRDIARKNEQLFVVYTPKDGSGFVSRFPDLVGLKNIQPSRSVEFLPYLRTKAEYTNPEAGDPFNDGSRFLPGFGADLKIGLSSNLTLNTTINPDFGQVEVDPAVVNLSDVETFFDEKRPFFIEGSSIFNFGYGGARSHWGFNWGSPDFFYSRRIGRAPSGGLPDNDYSDVPEGTRIIGAAKLSGKLGNNWSLGAIHGVTARENADIEYDGKKSAVEVEPLSHYSILRIQKEIDEGYRGIGIISTSTVRDFKDKSLKNEMNSNAYSFGLDGWSFLDSNRAWVVSAWGGMTHVAGTKERITDLQRNSRHYFQRPDAKSVSVDSNATSLNGFAGRVLVNKQKGNVIFNAAFGIIDPGFDVNDVGYMWRTNLYNAHVGTGYKWTKPGKFFRYHDFVAAAFQSRDFDGNLIWTGLFGVWDVQFLNYYQFELVGAYNPETYNIYRTRGGPITINKPGYQIGIELDSDSRKMFVVGLEADTYYRSGDDWERSLELGLEWKISDNLAIRVSPEIEWAQDNSMWVDDFVDPTASKTFGKRYVFADMKYINLSSGIRVNWTFTPKLSFQLYAQPLISSGDYYNYKYLDRPKSFAFNEFGEGASSIRYSGDTFYADADGEAGPAPVLEWENPDFNAKSLRGNAVLRWEYMPGSTLYLVWTQRRWQSEDQGRFNFGKSIDRLISTDSDNIFMVKLNYWWNL